MKCNVRHMFLFCKMFLFFQFSVFGQDNPFIGTWILESNPRITKVFTASTYNTYFDGILANNPASIGPSRYTYDLEKIYFAQTVQIRVGNSLINDENRWTSEYSFIDGKLNLGGQIHIRDPAEVARREREAARREQEAAEAAARREREAAETATRIEQETAEATARREREAREEIAQQEQRLKSLHLNTLGLSLGTTFAAPLVLATIRGTFSPLPYSFFEVGLDLGMQSTVEDTEYYSVYPFVHLAFFMPFQSKGGWYIGAGGGWMIGKYTFSEKEVPVNIFAADIITGFIIANVVDISWTIRTDFNGVNHKVTVGYCYRFR